MGQRRPSIVSQTSKLRVNTCLIVGTGHKACSRNVLDQIVVQRGDLSIDIREERRGVVRDDRVFDKCRSARGSVLQYPAALGRGSDGRIRHHAVEIECNA